MPSAKECRFFSPGGPRFMKMTQKIQRQGEKVTFRREVRNCEEKKLFSVLFKAHICIRYEIFHSIKVAFIYGSVN